MSNIGKDILELLRSKADAEWEYHNPYFLQDVNALIGSYYNLEDEKVDEWIHEMWGA